MNLISWSWNPDILSAEESVFVRDVHANLRAFSKLAEEEGLRELEEMLGNEQANDDDPVAFGFAGGEAKDDDEKPKLYLPVFGQHATARILAPPELTVRRVRNLASQGRGERDNMTPGRWPFAGPALACMAARNRAEPELGLFVLLLMFHREADGVTEWACDAHVVTTGFTIEREADYEVLRTAGAWLVENNLEALAAYQGLFPWDDWEPWGDQQ